MEPIRSISFVGFTGLVALICLCFVPSTAAGGTQSFGFGSKNAQSFTVPAGVTQLEVNVRGAWGGVNAMNGVSVGVLPGSSGYASGVVPVAPGQVLDIYVAEYGAGRGGWGWASGGAHGTTPPSSETPRGSDGASGAGGGGASAIISGSTILAVGAGGGGAGGEFLYYQGEPDGEVFFAGSGGDAGKSGTPGWGFLPNDAIGPNNQGRNGGCGGCRNVAPGYEGESTRIGQGGGAGGGGGGGYYGGGGGANGVTSGILSSDTAGAGGGGGSNFITSSALDPSTGATIDSNPNSFCQMTSSGGAFDPNCYGAVTLTWAGQPQAVTIQGPSSAGATVSEQFGDLKVAVTGDGGLPVSGATVTFAGPSSGAGAIFPGGTDSAAVVTDENGFATLPGLKANGISGSWSLTATASGTASPSAQYSMTNGSASASTFVSANPDPSYREQPVQVYAVVSSNTKSILATGSVQFSVDGTVAGPPVQIGAGSRATLPAGQLPALTVGSHTITAVYQGDAGHTGSQDSESQVVGKTPTSVSISSSINPSASGEDVELTALVEQIAGSSGTPTGSIEFRDEDFNLLGTVPIDSSGEAQLTTDELESGTVTAIYDGDDQFAPSTGRFGQMVGPEATGTVVTSSASPVVYGQNPTWTAQVSRSDQGAALEGTVGFETADGVVCPDAELDAQGRVTCTPTDPVAAGVHEVDAKYSPPDDSDDLPSTGSFNQVVLPAPSQTAATITPEPSVFGGPFTIGLEVSLPGNSNLPAEGSASLLIDGAGMVPLAVTGGNASRTVTCESPGVCLQPAGGHVIEADFTPTDENVLGSDVLAHHQVTAAPTSISVMPRNSPSRLGTAVTFTAEVEATPQAGVPTGRVAFTAGGAAIGQPVALTAGTATSGPVKNLTEGGHEIVAKYLGSSDYLPSDARTSQRVDRTADPVRGQPVIRFKGTSARLDHRGRFKVQVICEGDRGQSCRGRAKLRNRKSVRAAKRGRKGTFKARHGRLIARRALNVPAGDTFSITVKLNSFGLRVFRATKKLPSIIRFAPKSGTRRSAPKRLTVWTKRKLRRPGGRR